MDIFKISEILKSHSIPFYIDNGRIIADSMESGTESFEKTVDLTDFTLHDLYDWLGY